MIQSLVFRVIKFYVFYPVYILLTKFDPDKPWGRVNRKFVCLYPKINMFIGRLRSTESQMYYLNKNKIL